MQFKKEKVIIFSPAGDEIYVFIQNRHLTLASFRVNSSLNIKIKYTGLHMKIY